MAKNDNLIHYLTDIANAIREKNGTSDPINAQDFANEIKNGGNSGGETTKVFDALHFLDYQSPIWVNLVTKEYNTPIVNEEGIPVIHSGVLNKETAISYVAATGVITIPHNRFGDISLAPCVTMVTSNLGDEEYPDYRVVCGDLLISNVNFYKNGEIDSSAITRGYIEFDYGRTMLRLEYKEDDFFSTWEGNFEKVTFDITFPSGNTYKMEATGDVY